MTLAKNTADLAICSSSYESLLITAQHVARFPSTVLIEGETGVGKEVIAEYIHKHSPRAKMPFTKVNCASIPEHLMESELFGYEGGAFTGARREGHMGLFELSDKGTLLLDEISELSPLLQAKLLRVLQDREVRRVGGSWSRTLDVRILACTNQDLNLLVQRGIFRADLYYRLRVVYLPVPPLRDRKGEISGLLSYYLQRFNEEFGMAKAMSEKAVQWLTEYSFPGNVRELRNLVESLCVLSLGDTIDSADVERLLPMVESHTESKNSLNVSQLNTLDTSSHHKSSQDASSHYEKLQPTLAQAVAAVEERMILEALQQESSIRSAAKRLGTNHATLLRKMKQHGISGRNPKGG
ncbi:sigma-54-dependent Fis family transcriptional regulator [Alicyclobacillaceae bacterium I2511]|nr:sigma-54-dependent Fis family transcriptional regulator [Alicyclobacillaceae bacterium I2511]